MTAYETAPGADPISVVVDHDFGRLNIAIRDACKGDKTAFNQLSRETGPRGEVAMHMLFQCLRRQRGLPTEPYAVPSGAHGDLVIRESRKDVYIESEDRPGPLQMLLPAAWVSPPQRYLHLPGCC